MPELTQEQLAALYTPEAIDARFPIVHTGVKPRMLSPQIFPDYARNFFLGFTYYDDENQYVGGVTIFKVTPAGDITLVYSERPSIGKGDGFCMVQVGAHIQPFLSVHVGDGQSQLYPMPTCLNVCVPWPQGVEPHGQAGGFMVSEVIQEPQLTEQQVREIVRAEVAAGNAALVAMFGGGSVRNGIEEKAKDAMVEMLDAATIEDGREGPFRSLLASFNRDRCYEALVSYFGPPPGEDEPLTPAKGAV